MVKWQYYRLHQKGKESCDTDKKDDKTLSEISDIGSQIVDRYTSQELNDFLVFATTESKNSRASSMCPNFNLTRSISSKTILKQGFKCKIPNVSFNRTQVNEMMS